MNKYLREIDSIQQLRNTPTSDAAAAHVRTPTGQSGIFVPFGADPFGNGDDGGTVLQAKDGTYWVRRRAKQKSTFRPEDFGAVGDGSADDTNAFQSAIRAAETVSGTVQLTNGQTYKIGLVTVEGNLKIDGNNATVDADDNNAIALSDNIEFLKIEQVRFIKSNKASGGQGYHAFLDYSNDGDQTFNSQTNPGGQSGTFESFTSDTLVIKGCDFAFLKVSVTGLGEVVLSGNAWKQDDTDKSLKPYYLGVFQESEAELPLKMSKNNFNVHPADGDNEDIVKIGLEGTNRATISENFFKNRNENSSAELDMFKGGNQALVSGNTFVACRLKRQQFKGSTTSAPEISFDRITNNLFYQPDDFSVSTTDMLRVVGSLCVIKGNTFRAGGVNDVSCISMLTSDVEYDSFNTDEAVGIVVSSNLMDLRNVPSTGSEGVKFGTGDQGGKGISVSGNLFLGGEKMVSGTANISSVTGNVWLESQNASGTSLNTGPDSVISGNTVDDSSPTVRARRGNHIQDSTPIVDRTGDYTIDLSTQNSSLVRVQGGGTVTGFSGGYVGDEVTLFGAGNGATIEHNIEIKLDSSTNTTLTGNSTITLVKIDSSTWSEKSKSIV